MDSRYSEKQIQELRKQLIAEGLDERLVRLVGTVPLLHDDYKALTLQKTEVYRA